MAVSCRRKSSTNTCLWSFLSLLQFCSSVCSAANTISQGQSIRDGETIVSSGESFALGFFSPENSTSRYVGIWYYKIPVQTVVWVANRENPIQGNSGSLTLGNNGSLMVLEGSGNSIWSTNSSASSSGNFTAILVDSGNLILSSSSGKVLWQSCNDTTDTFLPEMTVYTQPGETRVFTSWKSATDPSPGRFSMGIDPRASPQIVIWDGLKRHWRSGPWNGLQFIGVPTATVYLYGFMYSRDENGSWYFSYTLSNSSEIVRFLVSWDGFEEKLEWDGGENQWNMIQSQPAHDCDLYDKCGAFAVCNLEEDPICSCLQGFVPKDEAQWKGGNWSEGCVRRRDLECGRNNNGSLGGVGDGFEKVEGVKLPDFADRIDNLDMKDCQAKCLNNCSCNAYAFVSGIGCLFWSEDLVDIQYFTEDGNDLYVRLANSELGNGRKFSKLLIIGIAVVGMFFICVSLWLVWRLRSRRKGRKNNQASTNDGRSTEFSTDISGPDDQRSGPELALFSFNAVAAATNNFSDRNKLGQGGFGPVYEGKLPGGEEIAVKRLSKKSGQGLEEFKNEVILIAKLQHRNLVRLLGWCIEGGERMLLYEYMPNKSLDKFLFDPTKQALLDWRKRFTIIEGIARGLLYLHRDSRLRIIHRDLKASNILLDEEMNSKISDFGMAKIFGRDENEASTTRVVGTFGYMAPEYAMEGLFSVKSDVYSFGVLLLEIVSGRRNSSFRSPEYSSIIGYAWDLWDCGSASELIDPSISDSYCKSEALRCIHVAMLCVQDMANHRPTMSSVLLMLETEAATLPMPRQPTYTSMRRSRDMDVGKESHENFSSNDITISLIIGR